ncbi:phage tail assembly protein [Pseudomonas putida]|uniref:phage tail assembly protein n=1 Tax=Pseudomonas putida TaxID=303 RepID=UPI000CD3BEAC|nr:phage tail assembly protein [Pseudomonas putida]POF97671.1 hypothetical protein BGP81_13480 [Pseudomonas putida]
MSQTYTLKHPFTSAAGARVESVEIRRLNRGDLRKAHGYSKDDFEQESFLLACMVGLVPEDLDQFDLIDSKALTEFFRNLVDGEGKSTNV